MELLTPSFGLLFWTLLAFLTVFFILRKFAWGPILKSLSERETGIAESIAAADRLKKAGVPRVDQIEALGEGFRGGWIVNPANIVHMVREPDAW